MISDLYVKTIFSIQFRFSAVPRFNFLSVETLTDTEQLNEYKKPWALMQSEEIIVRILLELL